MTHTKHKHYELLSFKEATMLIYEREGVKGYYRGFLPSIIKNTLNAGSYFSTLHYLRLALFKTQLFQEHTVNFTAAALARCLLTTLSNPIIVIKTRLEVLGFEEYKSLWDASKKIYYEEGSRGFFTGLRVSLIRDVPFSGVFFPIYEICKVFYSRLLRFDFINDTSHNRAFYLTLISSLSSITANLCSCLITHPYDIIRTREFFKRYNKDQTQHYQSITKAIFQIYEHDGLIGYFRGITPRIIRKGLGNIIAWGIFEYLLDKREIMID
jgi:solute carrier family 25 protein 38